LLLWIFIGPILLTHFSIFDFTKTGGIGDTISGISAPAIGLFSAILLYFALIKQIESNNNNQYESNFRIIYQEIANLKKEINDFCYDSKYGIDGINDFISQCSLRILMSSTEQGDLLLYIKKFQLPLLSVGRIFYLKDSLKTSTNYKDFIDKELIHIFDYYLKDAHSLSSEWSIVPPHGNTWTLNRLNFIKEELETIQAKIYKLQK
jgi:hypothetical protein